MHTNKPTCCTYCCNGAKTASLLVPVVQSPRKLHVFMKLIGTVNPWNSGVSAAVCISHILALRCMHGHSQSSNGGLAQSCVNDLEVRTLPREVAWKDDRLNHVEPLGKSPHVFEVLLKVVTEYHQRNEPNFLPILHSSLSAKRCSQPCQHLPAYCGCSWLIPTHLSWLILETCQLWPSGHVKKAHFVPSGNVIQSLFQKSLFILSLPWHLRTALKTERETLDQTPLFSSCIRFIRLERLTSFDFQGMLSPCISHCHHWLCARLSFQRHRLGQGQEDQSTQVGQEVVFNVSIWFWLLFF